MVYTQQLLCSQWQFTDIPPFTGGKMNPVFSDCGTGLENDSNIGSASSSFMHFFDDTASEDFDKYKKTLEKHGFEKLFENNICGNLFCQFRVPEGLLYISYMKGTGITRIILDRCRTCDTGNFGYNEYIEKNSDTVFAQYSLHYGKMIHGTSCDCGMNYVIRLRDNSLIIIDGGEFEQSTDIAVADYLQFLHTLTNTQPGEKLTVSLWLCTHSHDDHCDFTSKLMRFHCDETDIKRVAFNFPNPENTRHSPTISQMKSRVSEIYPHAEYIKLHTGSRFNIANALIEVFCINEDTIGMYDSEDDDPFPSTNDTSSIFRITADGIKILFLADCGDDNGFVFTENYDNTVTDCNIVQAAHHGINKIYPVYEKIKADYVCLPQCRMNMETRFPETFEHLKTKYGKNNIMFAAEATDIFTLKEGQIQITKRSHIGKEYDGSEW